MSWDCRWKTYINGEERCRRRKEGECYPGGGEYCVLYGKYSFPLRESEPDQINKPKKKSS